MHFDVPKVVRSPGWDQRHDEESRNGRDIKIDILEAYVWTSETFRVKSAILPEYRGVTGTPRGLLGHSGPKERREERRKRWPRAPPLPSPNRTREGGRRPPFPSSPPLSSPLLLFQVGVLFPVGVGLPIGAPRTRPAGLPLAPLYTGAGGHPKTHKLIFVIVP